MRERTIAQSMKVSTSPSSGAILQRACACACGQHTVGGGECEACRQKRLSLQRQAVNPTAPDIAPPLVHDVLRSPGQPLDQATRAFMETRFGHDFSHVRVHTDAKAAESARAVNALAYTVGQNVVFGAGQYAPRTSEGQRLLAHELTHTIQQTGGNIASRAQVVEATDHPGEQEAEQVAHAVMTRKQASIQFKSAATALQRAPITKETRKRIELCINPFYYDNQGRYVWGLDPKPYCSDMTIPADRERAWKCVDRFYWSSDGKTWEWTLEPEPNCSDVRLAVPLSDARAESPEEQAKRKEQERLSKIVNSNRARITAIRDKSPTDVEALARMFTDSKIVDDGTIPGRVSAILEATQHDFIPGLQTGIEFEQSGFRKEFHDPWKSSINQVGHFLTAVRLAFKPDVANNPVLLTILGAWGDSDVPLRLIIGHEKEPDPSILNVFSGFKAQYRATTEDDIKNFKAGNLSAIKVGKGRGNSMADLLLSHKGWMLGRWIAAGRFKSTKEIADWVRQTIGTLEK